MKLFSIFYIKLYNLLLTFLYFHLSLILKDRITHDLNSALQIGDKIIVLRDGKITWSGKPDKIFDVKDII